jgi:hypothetical protein
VAADAVEYKTGAVSSPLRLSETRRLLKNVVTRTFREYPFWAKFVD